MTQGIIRGCCARFSLHHHFSLYCRNFPYFARIFHQQWNCTWISLVKETARILWKPLKAVIFPGVFRGHRITAVYMQRHWKSDL